MSELSGNIADLHVQLPAEHATGMANLTEGIAAMSGIPIKTMIGDAGEVDFGQPDKEPITRSKFATWIQDHNTGAMIAILNGDNFADFGKSKGLTAQHLASTRGTYSAIIDHYNKRRIRQEKMGQTISERADLSAYLHMSESNRPAGILVYQFPRLVRDIRAGNKSIDNFAEKRIVLLEEIEQELDIRSRR